MKDTSYQVSAEKWSRVSSRYRREQNGEQQLSGQRRPEAPPDVAFFYSGGGLFSTAPDYIRFLRALLNGGEFNGRQILERETVELMAQNQIGTHEAGTMRTTNPGTSNDVNLFPESKDGFGLIGVSNQHRKSGEGTSIGKPSMGGAAQHLLLDRP